MICRPKIDVTIATLITRFTIPFELHNNIIVKPPMVEAYISTMGGHFYFSFPDDILCQFHH